MVVVVVVVVVVHRVGAFLWAVDDDGSHERANISNSGKGCPVCGMHRRHVWGIRRTARIGWISQTWPIKKGEKGLLTVVQYSLEMSIPWSVP